ncbi:MAG: SIR2 family protein [Deltaproteobacteria bacterium]|jgi:hypothetical protein|nr:SIR2 family protein [Deltaproteobacteria bacterium]
MKKIQFDRIPNFYLPVYEHLINVLRKGACIFFGAGISKIAGYKLWEELKVKMVDHFWANRDRLGGEKKRKFDYSFCQNLKRHEHIIEAFDNLYILNEDLYISGIKSIFDSDKNNTNDLIFKLLYKVNTGNSFYITTNIDKGFQNCAKIGDPNVSIYHDFSNPPKLINYIHGRIDYEKTWIFTREKYMEAYSLDSSPCMDFLKQIFDNYSVIFFGYGLREEEIMMAMAKTNKKRQHYWIEPIYRNKFDYLKIRSTSLKKNYNITLVPYSIDSLGHEAIIKVIESLNKATKIEMEIDK